MIKAFLFAAALLSLPVAAQTPDEQVLMLPAGKQKLETTLYRPAGPGPFPLLIVNHGKAPGDPRAQARDRFQFLAGEFVKRGYAVLVPMRSGFANSTGKFIQYGCNMTANGYGQAGDVEAVLAYARQQDWVDHEHIVIAGQSFGGLATMAASAHRLPGVRGVMNFAGGLKVHGGACDWQAALVKAFNDYGRKSRIASLWMYGENDSYFGPDLAQRMHQAFTSAGGHAELRAFGAFKDDAHKLLASSDGPPVWLPEVERFLDSIGMPTQVLCRAQDAAMMAPCVDDSTKTTSRGTTSPLSAGPMPPIAAVSTLPAMPLRGPTAP